MKQRPILTATWHLVAVCACTIVWGCTTDPEAPNPTDLRARFDLETFGELPYPPNNSYNDARIALGRLLFFDPILGGEQDVACGTCHLPNLAFADGRQFGAGVSGLGLGPARRLTVSSVTGNPIDDEPRNTPSVFNTGFGVDASGVPSYLAPMFWDGRAMGLEQQALMPITSRNEMRGDAFAGTEAEASGVAIDSIITRIRDIGPYVDHFREAFASDGSDTVQSVVTPSRLARALAAYQRELVTTNSAYDRFVLGDDDALNPAQRRGLETFFTKGKCSLCHRGAAFSNFLFRVTAAPQEGPGKTVIPGDDTGREEHTGRLEDRYAFRVPSLRNVALTGPYMHAGVFQSLEEVLSFYNRGAQPRNPNVPEDLIEVSVRAPLGLTDGEVNDVIQFLEALTDPGSQLDPLLLTAPSSVPSGLPPLVGIRAN